jgi:hypothetical protein
MRKAPTLFTTARARTSRARVIWTAVYLAALMAVLMTACGGAQSAATTNTTPSKAATPAAPPPAPIPADASVLIPRDASFLAHAMVAPFAEAKTFPTFRSWAERYACVASSDIDWFLASTRRVVVAGRGTRKAPEVLVILDGRYGRGDLVRALDLVEARTGGGNRAARTERVHAGRFTITSSGPLAATLLDDRLLMIGNDTLVTAALDLVVHNPPPKVFDDATFQALRTRVACEERSLCVLLAPDSAAASEVKRELSGAGMKHVGSAVANARTAIAIDPRVGLSLAVASEMASPDEAAKAVKETNDRLWQLGVFARLAGFPSILDDANVRAENALAIFNWQISNNDIARVQARLGDLLSDSASECPASAQPVGSSL